MRLVRHLLLVLALLAIAPSVASAACGSTIIDDYLDDGSVDGSYSQACFRDALGRLDDDLREYTNAESDITAAMRQQRPKPAAKPPATTASGGATSEPERTQSDEEKVPAANGGGSDDPPAPQVEEGGGQEPASTVADAVDTGAVLGVETEVAAVEDVTADDGPLQQALRSAGPSSGNDVPVPVLVLGGLAILLIAVGAGGLVLRRLQDN